MEEPLWAGAWTEGTGVVVAGLPAISELWSSRTLLCPPALLCGPGQVT